MKLNCSAGHCFGNMDRHKYKVTLKTEKLQEDAPKYINMH